MTDTDTATPPATDKLAYLAPELGRDTKRRLGIATNDLVEAYAVPSVNGKVSAEFPDQPGGTIITGTVTRSLNNTYDYIRTEDGTMVEFGAGATKVRARKIGAGQPMAPRVPPAGSRAPAAAYTRAAAAVLAAAGLPKLPARNLYTAEGANTTVVVPARSDWDTAAAALLAAGYRVSDVPADGQVPRMLVIAPPGSDAILSGTAL